MSRHRLIGGGGFLKRGVNFEAWGRQKGLIPLKVSFYEKNFVSTLPLIPYTSYLDNHS